MPCDKEARIHYLDTNESCYGPEKASELFDDFGKNYPWPIIGWRYAEIETKTVPLGPEDVPPGSVFRSKDQPDTAFWAVAQVWTGGFYLRGENVDWPLAMERMEINRPKHRDADGNPTLWEPCHKQSTV